MHGKVVLQVIFRIFQRGIPAILRASSKSAKSAVTSKHNTIRVMERRRLERLAVGGHGPGCWQLDNVTGLDAGSDKAKITLNCDETTLLIVVVTG